MRTRPVRSNRACRRPTVSAGRAGRGGLRRHGRIGLSPGRGSRCGGGLCDARSRLNLRRLGRCEGAAAVCGAERRSLSRRGGDWCSPHPSAGQSDRRQPVPARSNWTALAPRRRLLAFLAPPGQAFAMRGERPLHSAWMRATTSGRLRSFAVRARPKAAGSLSVFQLSEVANHCARAAIARRRAHNQPNCSASAASLTSAASRPIRARNVRLQGDGRIERQKFGRGREIGRVDLVGLRVPAIEDVLRLLRHFTRNQRQGQALRCLGRSSIARALRNQYSACTIFWRRS